MYKLDPSDEWYEKEIKNEEPFNHAVGGEKMPQNLIKGLLPVNCAYNFKEEEDDLCHSKTCMLNQDPETAKKISEKGCIIFKREEVKKVLERNKKQ